MTNYDLDYNYAELTRGQAIELVGLEIVEKLDKEKNREYFSRDDDCSIQEWISYIEIDTGCEFSRINAHYFIFDGHVKEALENSSTVEWKINHYSVQ